jgi:hypothetical protein
MSKEQSPDLGLIGVFIDAREQKVEIPHLLQLETALLNYRTTWPGKVARSRARLDVYRAIRTAGEICSLTVPELAPLAGWSVREVQKALRDLVAAGWLKQLTSVAARGGMVSREGGRMVRAGNSYVVTRPNWAWNGQHHKHLTNLRDEAPALVGVHSLHPCFQALKPGKACAPTQMTGRGAQPAPLEGCTAASPLSLINKGTSTNKEKSTPKRSAPLLKWSVEAQPFADLWKGRYKHPLYCNKQNLDKWRELVQLTGSETNALETAKNYLASDAPRLTASRHALAILNAAFQQYQPLEAPEAKPAAPRRPLIVQPSLLERLMAGTPALETAGS